MKHPGRAQNSLCSTAGTETGSVVGGFTVIALVQRGGGGDSLGEGESRDDELGEHLF